MQLEVGIDIVAPGFINARRIEANRSHALGNRRAVKTLDLLGITGRDVANDGPRTPEVGSRVAAALLFAERDQLYRAQRVAKLLQQRPYRHIRGDDAEGTVVAATWNLRVDVRPGD